jgi:hypothetical protein
VSSVLASLLPADHPWRLDLTSLAGLLAAGGTLALAGVTAWLAASTRKLAGETGDDVRSQSRPVLLLKDGSITVERQSEYGPAVVTGVVVNRGRGPAVNALADVSSETSRGFIDEDAVKGETIPLAILAVDEERRVAANGLHQEDAAVEHASLSYYITLVYEDLGGHGYETILSFDDTEHGKHRDPPTYGSGWGIALSSTMVHDRPPGPSRRSDAWTPQG